MINLSNSYIKNINDNIELLTKINENDKNCSIDLSHNNINLFDFKLLNENYQEINLSNNKIVHINLNMVKRDKIFLGQNQISDIIVSNMCCDYLDISENMIKNITFINCVINSLNLSTNLIENIKFINSKVKELDLSVNQLKFINYESYPNNIEKMSLFANKLTSITNMPNTMKKIDVSDNKLKELTYISKNLVSIDISKNLLVDFDTHILPETLNYFDIRENKIKNKNIFNCLSIQNIMFDDFNYGLEQDSDFVSDSVFDFDSQFNSVFNSGSLCDLNCAQVTAQQISDSINDNSKTELKYQVLSDNQSLNNINTINDYSVKDGNLSDSDVSIQFEKRHIRTINLSDGSEESDNLDINNLSDNETALADTNSDETSDDEIDLWNFTQQFKNHKQSNETYSTQENINDIFDNNLDENSENQLLDDEISQALNEYNKTIQEDNKIVEPKYQNNSNQQFNNKSRDIFDFLKNDSEELSEDNAEPTYEKYNLFWEICM